MTWTTLETSTHQDHVIAHVIGATPLGHFFWDETGYLLLDIGFIWKIYLDLEMGLLPHSVAIAELEVEDTVKTKLRGEIDALLQGGENPGPIQSVDVFESEDGRRLLLNCEERNVVIETSLATGQVKIDLPRMDTD